MRFATINIVSSIWIIASIAAADGDGLLSLNDVLEKSRTVSPEVNAARARYSAQDARASAVNGAYDPVLFSKLQMANDKSEQNSNFAGTERKIRKAEVGVRKLFGTGTQVELSSSYEKYQTAFPGPPPPTVILNPSHTGQLTLTLRQPLWRNFLAREIRLQQRMQESQAESAKLGVELRSQIVQAETEQLYWNVIALQAQKRIAKELEDKTKLLAKSMQERKAIGRADEVDVINAESRVVQSESQYLDLEIAELDARQRLASKIGMDDSSLKIPEVKSLETSPMPLPIDNAEAAWALAKTQRIDLQIAQEQTKPILLQEKLAEEQYKPTINFFASLGSNGIEDSRSEGIDEAFSFDHKTTVLGLELEWTPYHRKSSYEAFAAQAQLRAAEYDVQLSLIDLQRDIKLAFQRLRAASTQEKQARRQFKYFSDKLESDLRKFRQVRAERVVVVSDEIEKLSANMKIITAHLNARNAEAMIRLALHGYPKGSL